MSEEDEYYILDTRTTAGDCAWWWGPDRRGYVCSLDEAGVYTKAEAVRQQERRPTDRAVPKSKADALAVRHVRIEQLRRDGFA